MSAASARRRVCVRECLCVRIRGSVGRGRETEEGKWRMEGGAGRMVGEGQNL